mmetsp:Transcript_13565/g.39041  ORF Transcript_13565/g.39041 Transcript_13565/m.39041 type:complete len:893 (+) Transcript_13565:349-3027(+)
MFVDADAAVAGDGLPHRRAIGPDRDELELHGARAARQIHLCAPDGEGLGARGEHLPGVGPPVAERGRGADHPHQVPRGRGGVLQLDADAYVAVDHLRRRLLDPELRSAPGQVLLEVCRAEPGLDDRAGLAVLGRGRGHTPPASAGLLPDGDPVGGRLCGRGVDDDDDVGASLAPPPPSIDAAARRVLVQPLEADLLIIAPVQGGQVSVHAQQAGHPRLQALPLRICLRALQVERRRVRPRTCGDLCTHEEQRPSWHADDVGEQHPQMGEPGCRVGLPSSCHLFQPPLAVRVVVRQGEHPPLVEGVRQVPRELLPPERLRPRSVGERGAQKAERVVGEAHVPLEVEAQVQGVHLATLRALDGWPGGDPLEIRALLGEEQHARAALPHSRAQVAEEPDAFLVHDAPACEDGVAVVLPTEASVHHGRHRVQPEAVDVELVDPVLGRPEEVGSHLRLAVIEAGGAPSRQLAQLALVLELGGAAVPHQAPGVLGKVGAHEIHEHSDAMPVKDVDQVAEVVRRAQAAVHGVEARGALVPPGLVRRVLRQREELHRGEAHLRDVLGQGLGEGAIAPRLGGRHGGPAAQVHLVDRQRLRCPAILAEGAGAVRQPLGVGPAVGAVPVPPGELVALRHLGVVAPVSGMHELEAERVRLDGRLPLLRHDVVAVLLSAEVERGDEHLPHAEAVARAHRVRPAIPEVEVPHDAHRTGVGSPDSEARAPQAGAEIPQLHVVRAEERRRRHLALRRSCGPSGERCLREQRSSEAVWVCERGGAALAVLHLQLVAPAWQVFNQAVRRPRDLESRLIEPAAVRGAVRRARHRHLRWRVLLGVGASRRQENARLAFDEDLGGPAHPAAKHDHAVDDLRPQDLERIRVLPADEQPHVLCRRQLGRGELCGA